MEGDESSIAARGVRGAHLVGSVPLAGSEQVFRQAAGHLGAHLRRVPDGETGRRANWIAWQLEVFRQLPGLESEVVDIGYMRREKFRLRQGAPPPAFPALGYSGAALDSYQRFARLREAGVIAPTMRFMVALPTPFAPLHAFLFPETAALLAEAYESRMRQELEEILAAVPHADLALQWDAAIEFAVLEKVVPSCFDADEILEKLTACGGWVPAGVELGYHLCYGDAGGRHFKEPADTALLVRVSNHLARTLRRSLDWLHLPVPRERVDEDYYRPLAQLSLTRATTLYLGLLHLSDGVEGAQRRIAAARRHAGSFGVATECGFGRRAPETVGALLDLHRAVLE
jgi:hypothetical protein